MKCTPDDSEDTSMSIECCSLKLRILILVMATADLINERATPTMGMSHAIIAPVTIFTTYFLIGVLVIGALRKKFATYFLQTYALIVCSVLQIYLSIVVFSELKWTAPQVKHYTSATLALNGVLPMLMIVITLADLILVFFKNRNVPSPPVLPDSS